MEGFPFHHVSPIVGQPTYGSLAELHLKLNANAESVHSNLGNGLLDLLYLTISLTVYGTLSVEYFIPPTNPGAAANAPHDVSGPTAANLRHSYQIQLDLFNGYGNTDKALKKILFGAIDEIYIWSLRNKYAGYQNHTTQNILNHMYTTYTNISSTDLRNNDKVMKTVDDTNQSIEVLIEQIENTVEFTAFANTQYMPV